MGQNKASAAILAVLDPGRADPDEFAAWYDTEHLPERRRVPGILSAQRWLTVDEPSTSVAFYDLVDLDVLDYPEYRAISGEGFSPWSRRILAQCDAFHYYEVRELAGDDRSAPDNAQGLYVVGMNVDDASDAEFNAWYDEEHLPRLAAVPGVLRARRYEAVEGPQRYVAVYDLEDPAVYGSPLWLEAAETPWTRQMRQRTSDRFKLVCRRPAAAVQPRHNGGIR